MLDIMRKGAKSWLTWVIFGGLIVVFAFFFGYNDIGVDSQSNSAAVAKVNGKPILRGAYDIAYDSTRDYYKNLFRNNLPTQFEPQIRKMALNQLVERKLLAEYGKELGLVVTDQQLAEEISKIPQLRSNGVFDPLQYRESFLPNFKQSNNMPFEPWLREQLLADKMREVVGYTVIASPDEAMYENAQLNSKFTFEIVTLNVFDFINDKKVKTREEVVQIAHDLQEVFDAPEARKLFLDQYKLEVTNTGPIDINQRKNIPNNSLNIEQQISLWSLTEDAPNCPAPLETEENIFVCRLVSREIDDGVFPSDTTKEQIAKYSDSEKSIKLSGLVADIQKQAQIELLDTELADN